MRAEIDDLVIEFENGWSGLASELELDRSDSVKHPDVIIGTHLPGRCGIIVGDEAVASSDGVITDVGGGPIAFAFQEVPIFSTDLAINPLWTFNNLVLPSLYLFGPNHGMALTHCCAIHFEERGILICGPGGSSRTTLSLFLLERGAHMVSDDFTLLTPNGKARRVKRSVTIECTLEGPNIKDNTTLAPSIRRLIPNISLRHSLLRTLLCINRFPPRRFVSPGIRKIAGSVGIRKSIQIADIDRNNVISAAIDKIIFPMTQRGIDEPFLRKISADRASQMISTSTEMEFKHLFARLILLQYALPNAKWVDELLEACKRERRIVSQALHDASASILGLPERWKHDETIPERLLDLLS